MTGRTLDPSLITAVRFSMMAVLSAPLFPRDLFGSQQAASSLEDDDSQAAPAGGGAAIDVGALARAALELAVLGTAGTLFNTWGIERTSAVRAALLLSAVNIATPVLSVLIGSPKDRAVSARTWAGCAAAFAATAYATLGGGAIAEGVGGPDFGPFGGFALGDIAVLCAAVCYGAVKVRLGPKARLFPAEALATGRLVAGAALAVSIFAVECLLEGAAAPDWRRDLGELQPQAWGVFLFSALTPGVLATLLQAKGQRVVPPAQAQTIYALVPLISTLYDFFILQEPIEARELAAGAVIVASAAFSS